MSDFSTKPYPPSIAEPKLPTASAANPRRRDIALFVLLNVVTLGLYWFYVAFRWAKELNGLHGRAKYSPWLVLVTSILTCGIIGLVFECLYAFDLQEATRSRGIQDRNDQLPTWVIVCNCVAFVVAVIPFGVGVALPLGILASVLVQVELNKIVDAVAPLA